MWRASLPKWEKLLRSLAPHVLKMAVAPADRRGFLADVVLYVHVCFRAARARRKRTAGGAKRRDHRTADPERSGLRTSLRAEVSSTAPKRAQRRCGGSWKMARTTSSFVGLNLKSTVCLDIF